ncbi:hypothetical protein EIO_0453 [Ketogulonicigenium vulgare Y25]|nr:hypothetical protein EIO_0453 [Ketogulonicigenium vulgare Y25]AOZ53547.1 hypothetical protein KVC_0522 [Ketogulonicigenium vulgare]
MHIRHTRFLSGCSWTCSDKTSLALTGGRQREGIAGLYWARRIWTGVAPDLR